MSDRGALLPTLERLFAGPREQTLTIDALLAGLETRSYAFIVAALCLPNCVPTGIPLLSTVTGVPMLIFAIQGLQGRPTPSLPTRLANHALPRGKLQDFLARARGPIGWIESIVHPRFDGWLRGGARSLLHLAWVFCILILALPIPFDNFLPAWATLFFCMALLERDGIMAMLGWLFTLLTALWTVFLLVVGPYVLWQAVKSAL
ncbi:MAG: exopolysaccharide biosynthesis protein [Proteobacteria bacterium]|nr:exopolysaccharide biosynthesis protein [Pseudomonadota bacterium]